ncbi:MAG: putative 2OG-Fe(II) oxygenase [Pseudomonadota bacterium]
MRWIDEPEREPALSDLPMPMLRAALAARPDDKAYLALLGDALMAEGQADAAIDAFERSARQPGSGVWPRLIAAHRRKGDLAAALAAHDAAPPSSAVAIEHARTLRKLGRTAEAGATLAELVRADPADPFALEQWLELLASDADGARLLDACASVAPPLRDSALVRGHVAIGLSRVGREDEARALVDVDRHVWRGSIAVPPGYADIAAFNRALATEMRAEVGRVSAGMLRIDYRPRTVDRPARTALLDVIRDAFAAYIDSFAKRGLRDVMQPPPAVAKLAHASVQLTHDGANGEHIHGEGYLSAVYHVTVPPDLTGRAGALSVGPTRSYTRGYQGCWGVRDIAAVPGWLTIFPSHIFHDVVPTGVATPRLSIAADLRPA